MEKIFENSELLIYSTPSLDIINDSIIEHTLKKMDEYRRIFKREKLDKCTIILYDDLEEYRSDARRIRKCEPAEYSRGWFNSRDRVSYCCFDLERLKEGKNNIQYWDNCISSSSHELFHFYYRIYYYGNHRITWFDEGMAQYLSGETASYSNNTWYNVFKRFIENYKPINNLNDRVNGNSSIPDELIFKRANVFDGYTAGLLAIKYLFDTKGEEYVFDLMFDNTRILEEGEDILDRMITYYKEIYSDKPQIKKS